MGHGMHEADDGWAPVRDRPVLPRRGAAAVGSGGLAVAGATESWQTERAEVAAMRQVSRGIRLQSSHDETHRLLVLLESFPPEAVHALDEAPLDKTVVHAQTAIRTAKPQCEDSRSDTRTALRLLLLGGRLTYPLSACSQSFRGASSGPHQRAHQDRRGSFFARPKTYWAVLCDSQRLVSLRARVETVQLFSHHPRVILRGTHSNAAQWRERNG